MSAPRYSVQLLRAGSLALDGGSMFGVVPRVVWEKLAPPDERGRIRAAHNALLLSPVDRPEQLIVIEVGSGDKFDAKNRDLFGLGDESILTELAKHSIDPEQVQNVIVTHLHFDHAGGLTRLNDAGRAVPTFLNATVHVQRREWNDANANNSVMTRTYLRENLDPIREQVKLIDSSFPYSHDFDLTRELSPTHSLEDRLTEILPGIFTFIVPGHTRGQQAILFTDSDNRSTVFVPDLIPTANHVGAAYNMAYDTEPFVSMQTRRWFLQEAVKRDWRLVLVHDMGPTIYRARANDRKWFELIADR